MKIRFVFLIILAACFDTSEHMVVQGPSVRKQKQKIALLQKKLDAAEQEKRRVQSEVERLAFEIDQAQIALIRKQVDKYETKNEKAPSLFLEEREALYRMIQMGPSPASFEAQVELDRILRLITELSDEGKTCLN